MNFSTTDITTGRQEATIAFAKERDTASNVLGLVGGFEAGFNAAVEYIRKEGAITVGEEDLWPPPPVHPAPKPDYAKEFEEMVVSEAHVMP